MFADSMFLNGDVLSLEQLSSRFTSGELAIEVPDGTWIRLPWTDRTRIRAENYRCYLDPVDFIDAMRDEMANLGGRPTSEQKCREAFEKFSADPSEAQRLELREAYERVPQHRRQFLGAMDNKDGEYLLAIFGREGALLQRREARERWLQKYTED